MGATVSLVHFGSGNAAELFFRLARVCLLTLIVIMPMEAITAAREIGLVGVAVLMALHLIFSPAPRPWRATPLALPLLLYAATAVMSLFTAVDFHYTLRELRAEVVKGMLLFYASVHFVQHERHLAQAWAALLWGAGIMSLAGVVLYFTDGGNPLETFVRAGSLHNGYGGFGTFLVTVWPYMLLAPLAFDQPRWRPWLVALIAVTAAAAYLTYSRATWLGMVVSLALCLLVVGRKRLRNALLAALASVLLLTGLFLAPGSSHGEHWTRLLYEPEAVGGTAGDLFALWSHAIEELQEQPWRGIGLGRHSFSKAYREFRDTHQPLLWHAHNMFFDLALQLGLQGLAAVLLVMLSLIALLWPRSPPGRGEQIRLFGAATAIMVIGFAVRNFFDDFFVDDSSQLFWLLAGLALGGRQLRKTGGAAEDPVGS